MKPDLRKSPDSALRLGARYRNLAVAMALAIFGVPKAYATARYSVGTAVKSGEVSIADWVAGAAIETTTGITAGQIQDNRIAVKVGHEKNSVEAILALNPMSVRRFLGEGDSLDKETKEPSAVAILDDTANGDPLDVYAATATSAREAVISNTAKEMADLILTVTTNERGAPVLVPNSFDIAVGMSIRISVAARRTSSGSSGPSIFVRESDLLTLSPDGTMATARRNGQTEIIVTHGSQLAVARVQIGPVAMPELAELSVSDELTSLSFDQVSRAMPGGGPRAARAESSAPMSLEESKRRALETLANHEQGSRAFSREDLKVGYKEVVLQLLDERSVPTKGELFPVGGVSVSLVGTRFVAESSPTGHVTIPNVPTRSRLLVSISDKRGGYLSEIAEFRTDDSGASQLVQLPMLRTFTFDNSAAVAGVVPRAGLASLCGTIYDHEASAAEGLAVSLDQGADGPYYYNRFGFLDRTLSGTGPNGRFCFYNIEAGPVAADISGPSVPPTMVPLALFSGKHHEEEIRLNDSGRIVTRLAAVATVHEQLGSDETAAVAYRSIDMVDLRPLGTDEPLMQLGSGLAGSQEPLMSHGDRVFAVSRASEFESTLYSYGSLDSAGPGDLVTPLFPRGFIEDMAIFAQATIDQDLGSVVVEHGDVEGQTEGAISIRLLDERGNAAGQGWYFGDRPVTKAIYFNVNPGKYLVLTETSEGYWLAVDTVVVYNRTVSYIRSGSRVRFRSAGSAASGAGH